MSTHGEVIEKYAGRKHNARAGGVDWRGHNVFCEDRILYSYGHHYILAVFLPGVENPGRPGGAVFLKNGDRVSSSTGQHQAITQRNCDGPTVSFAGIEAAELDPQTVQIIDWTGDRTVSDLERNKDTGRYKIADGDGVLAQWTPPPLGMFIKVSEDDETSRGYWHVLGSVLLSDPDGARYFLGSLDERTYFLAELPGKPRTVDAAFAMLKPDRVKRAERKGADVVRQGEWFFVDTGQTDADLAASLGISRAALKRKARQTELPVRPGQDNVHVVRTIRKGGGYLARGNVYHRNAVNGTSSGEHRALKLGETWHAVYKNRERQSWTVGGKFD